MKKIIFTLTIFLALFLFSYTEAKADGCGYICKDTTETNEAYCTKTRGAGSYLGSIISNTDCPGQANCGMNSVPICCCTAKSSLITPVSGAKAKFTLPDYTFQIPIGNLSSLKMVDCSSGTCEVPFIAQYISAAYTYGLSIAAILAVLIIMAAGLLWMVSGGDSGKKGQAKKMILGSILGLALVVGLSLFLSFINPNLIITKNISLDNISRIDLLTGLSKSRNNSTEEKFKNATCATNEELKKGVEFYATGYYKPAYNKSDPDFFCIIAMQCSCPKGRNLSKTCDIYKKTYPNYHPCNEFDANTPYCNMTSSETTPEIGDIAGPPCPNLPEGTLVCYKGKTYKITDRGGGITGRRIDIWSGSDLKAAYANTGTGILKKGACK